MAKVDRLFSGIFVCPACSVRYQVEDAQEGELFCESCGEDLDEVEANRERREEVNFS